MPFQEFKSNTNVTSVRLDDKGEPFEVGLTGSLYIDKLLNALKVSKKLAQSIDRLNPKYPQLGAGMFANLIEQSKEVLKQTESLDKYTKDDMAKDNYITIGRLKKIIKDLESKVKDIDDFKILVYNPSTDKFDSNIVIDVCTKGYTKGQFVIRRKVFFDYDKPRVNIL